MLSHEDPGVDRRIRQLLKSMHEQAQQAAQQPGPDFSALPYEQLQAMIPLIDAQLAPVVEAAFGPPPQGAPPPEQREIDGLDGNRVPIEIFRPLAPAGGPLPCVVYLHGGGMGLMSVQSYRPVLQHLANQGVVVVAPAFRNSPVARFPAGLHDCLATALWARANLDALGASGVVLAGESGGGCLALTVPLVALQRGLDPAALLDGVWADAPLCFSPVDPAWAPLRQTGANGMMDLTLRRMYTDRPEDPCAFPMNAPLEALRRFPRTVLVIYAADPMRDEGLAFYRRMLVAEHDDVDCMELHGLTHASMLARSLVPGFSTRQFQRLVAFAR